MHEPARIERRLMAGWVDSKSRWQHAGNGVGNLRYVPSGFYDEIDSVHEPGAREGGLGRIDIHDDEITPEDAADAFWLEQSPYGEAPPSRRGFKSDTVTERDRVRRRALPAPLAKERGDVVERARAPSAKREHHCRIRRAVTVHISTRPLVGKSRRRLGGRAWRSGLLEGPVAQGHRPLVDRVGGIRRVNRRGIGSLATAQERQSEQRRSSQGRQG